MNISDLFVGGNALWILPLSLLVFGAAFGLLPGLLLRLFVLLYPKSDPNRRALYAELYAAKGRFERFEWVFQQLETGLRDGLGARRDIRRRRKAAKALREQLAQLEPRGFIAPASGGISTFNRELVKQLVSQEAKVVYFRGHGDLDRYHSAAKFVILLDTCNSSAVSRRIEDIEDQP